MKLLSLLLNDGVVINDIIDIMENKDVIFSFDLILLVCWMYVIFVFTILLVVGVLNIIVHWMRAFRDEGSLEYVCR